MILNSGNGIWIQNDLKCVWYPKKAKNVKTKVNFRIHPNYHYVDMQRKISFNLYVIHAVYLKTTLGEEGRGMERYRDTIMNRGLERVQTPQIPPSWLHT